MKQSVFLFIVIFTSVKYSMATKQAQGDTVKYVAPRRRLKNIETYVDSVESHTQTSADLSTDSYSGPADVTSSSTIREKIIAAKYAKTMLACESLYDDGTHEGTRFVGDSYAYSSPNARFRESELAEKISVLYTHSSDSE